MKELRYWECPECHHFNPYLQKKCDCGHVAGGGEAKYKSCPSCGCLLPASRLVCDCGAFLTRRHVGARIVVLVLSVLCAVSIVGNIYQVKRDQEKSQEITTLQREVRSLEGTVNTMRASRDFLSNQVQDLKDEIAELEDYNDFATEYAIAGLFMYDSIGFIVPGSRYCHRYDCPVFQDADSYWAHNIEYCAGQGYSKHAACWED